MSHTLCYADRNLRFADLLDIGSRPGVARSPSIYLAGTDNECCISISLGPLHLSWGYPEVELTTMSILNPSRERGRKGISPRKRSCAEMIAYVNL